MGGVGGEIKCPCTEKHETIKMGKTRRKKGMSCNRDGRVKQYKKIEKRREQRAEEDDM